MPEEPTIFDIASQYFPDESAAYLEHIIWHETGFPCFWNPEDGATPLDCFRMQLARAAARENFGFFGYYDGNHYVKLILSKPSQSGES